MQKNRPVIYKYKMKFSGRIVSILLAVVLVLVCILLLQTVGAPYNKAGREGATQQKKEEPKPKCDQKQKYINSKVENTCRNNEMCDNKKKYVKRDGQISDKKDKDSDLCSNWKIK